MSSTIKRQSEQKKSLPFLFCSFLVQWVDTTFTTTVQNRGAQIIAARGASSCASAVRDFFFSFFYGTKICFFPFLRRTLRSSTFATGTWALTAPGRPWGSGATDRKKKKRKQNEEKENLNVMVHLIIVSKPFGLFVSFNSRDVQTTVG
jgi:hypothetical protein